VRCGLPTAEDCAVVHWCRVLDGQRERSEWRADCPLCGNNRSLKWEVRGKGIWWWSYCYQHGKPALRPVLADHLPGCLPGRPRGRQQIDHDDLIALVLTPMPPMTLRLRLLEMAGMGTQAALDKLDVRPDNRARVIHSRTGDRPSERTRKPRS